MTTFEQVLAEITGSAEPPTVEKRFATVFREEPTDEPGLVLGVDGVVYLVGADGTRVAVGTGGSQAPVNWCTVQATQATAVTSGDDFYDFLEGDLAIAAQSGSDFTLGTDPSLVDGAIISASGGIYQAVIIAAVDSFAAISLDGSSAKTRYLAMGLSLGPFNAGPISGLTQIGIDALLPILSPAGTRVTITAISTPGYVQPGESVLAGIFSTLVAGVGTDSVKLGPFTIGVWQTGALPT